MEYSEKAMRFGTSDYLINGLVFFGCGQLEKGLKMLENALKSTPHDTDLRISKNLMAGYLATKQYQKAIEHGQSKMNRKDGLSYILTAFGHFKLGDETKARKLIEQQKSFDKKMDSSRFEKEFATFTDQKFIEQFFSDVSSLGMD